MADITSERRSHALTRLNRLPAEPVRATLLTCCAASAWATMVEAGRPYASLDDLLKYSDAALATLTERLRGIAAGWARACIADRHAEVSEL